MEFPEKSLEKKEQKKDIEAKSWVDPKGNFYNLLVLSGNTITAKGGVTVFGKNKLVGQCSFTVKFTKIGDFVIVGVSDTQNRNKYNMDNNRIRYNSDGDCYVADYCAGKFGIFKVGDIVTVAVDMD